jgi:hypothetical protein
MLSVNDKRQPLADTIPEIVAALAKINKAAARDFLVLFLGRFAEKDYLWEDDKT